MHQAIKPGKRLMLLGIGIVLSMTIHAQFQQLTEKITLNLYSTTALQVIESIDKQSQFHFSFAPEQFANKKIDSIKVNGIALGSLLQQLEKKHGFQFTVREDQVLVKWKTNAAGPDQKKATGRITGKVVDFENGDPLTGATVSLESTGSQTVTNDKGEYVFTAIPPGEYAVAASYVGYKKDKITQVKVAEEKTVVIDIKLQVGGENPAVMTGVIVTALKNKRVINTTDAQLISELYRSKTVISGISNEQIARTLDRDAAEVVKRIPGINISPDNFVIVRGLGKRYNLTFLNDAMAPAADADSRAFSYDMISSNAIDRIMVYKSPSPDLPGEFSGGLVKIYTKKSQVTRQVDVQLSAQYRPNSTFENTWSYAGGKYDFLGFDDGTRQLPSGIPNATAFNQLNPADNARYSRQFKNIYTLDRNYRALPDLRFNLNYYDAWKIGNRYLRNLTTIAYTHTHEQRLTEQHSLYRYDGQITQGIHGARISAIQSNEIKASENLTLEWRNFFNVNNQRVAVEDFRLLDGRDNQEFRHTNLYYVQQLLYSSQLTGTYQFGKDKVNSLKANISYSSIHKQEPDNRDYTLNRQTPRDGETGKATPWVLGHELISFYTLSRVFTDVKENNYQGNIDLTYRINPIWGLKSGIYHETRERSFSNRTFAIFNGVNLYDQNIAITGSKFIEDNGTVSGHNSIQEAYLPHYFRESMFREDGTGYRWMEKTTPNNQYKADNVLNAGYISTDINLLQDRINVFGGLRVEHNRFRILGSYPNGLATYPLLVDQPITSWLPSANISFHIDSSMILRAGYGKTLNRPEFREAAPLRYTNYIDQEVYTGNPNLTTVNIHNAEIRWEWYPSSARKTDMVNAGFFYKNLDRPIERFRMVFVEAFDQYVYSNTGNANVWGLEAELRKDFDFIPGSFFRRLSTVLNGAWFKSEVKVPAMPQFPGYNAPRVRPMQGQSPYLLNASLNYEDAGRGTKVSATFNRAADYIYAVGSRGGTMPDADIMMRARNQLDITWRQRINKIFSINAGVQNILNAPFLLYQDWTQNYEYNAPPGKPTVPANGDTDLVFRKFHQYPYFSFAVNMIF
ncbi:MAG: TonB-dependent receptor [Candidatus Pseudobacter hemicellulosilyticus]|uniref:TonB-dependent receptor n=1 Tax=Candidatus Pseudobacter hemicellulosilyticus TaxID=3121375 RepID=A0AAJ6BJX9_9BACT|nr:MAG: TonB-dependent receptor [Pseudobacter sp.]